MRSIRTIVASAGLTAGLVLANTGAVAAQPIGVLDASNLVATPSASSQGPLYQYFAWAETFTALHTGQLTGAQVDLFLFAVGTPPADPFTVEVRDLDTTGNPSTGPALASAIVPASAVTSIGPLPGTLVTVTFDQPPIVTAGQQYALVLTSHSSTSFAVSFDDTASYPGGNIRGQFDPFGQFGPPGTWFDYGSLDLIFAVYVHTTTPFASYTPTARTARIGTQNRLTVDATFRLGVASNGISPIAEGLSVDVNGVAIVVPPNAFRRGSAKELEYNQSVGGNRVLVSLDTERPGCYHLHATLTGGFNPPVAPQTVTLTIGDDRGQATATTR